MTDIASPAPAPASAAPPERCQKTHDYTHRCWGHDYIFRPTNGGLNARMSGWGSGIHSGDFIIMAHSDGSGETARYHFDKIDYCQNPTDMWHASVSFAPRNSPACAGTGQRKEKAE